MTFLAPALLVGLLAIAIPIVVHLVQRERKTVVAFPSLMFLRRIPNQSMRRRAIRHWPLLALRILALVLIALAFGRPFWPAGSAQSIAAAGTRQIVVLLDTSASMGYAGHWAKAQDEARRVVRGLRPGDRAAVVLFATDVEVAAPFEAGPGALVAAIDRARPGSGITRYGPALRAAAGLLEAAMASRREIVLVSDFQRSGWDPSQDVKVPAGVTLMPVSVGEASTSNVALASLHFERQAGAKSGLVTATARVVNHSAQAVTDRELTLTVDGQRVDGRRVSMAPNAAADVTFTPFALGSRAARVTTRLAADALPTDDVFHAVVVPGGQVPVLVIESANPSPDASLYLTRALDVAAAPGFATRIARTDRVTPEEIAAASVVVLNDARPPQGAAGRAMASAVDAGAGLLVLLGGRSIWTSGDPDLLPGVLGAPADRSATGGGTLGYVDFSHPVFEIFASPRSGDLTAPRIFRYRLLTAPGKALARFDDGAVAAAERKIGQGTVIAWASTFDTEWTDLPLKPVFVPLVQELMQHLGRYVEPRPWYAVGDTYDPADAPPAGPGRRVTTGSAFTVVAPSGRSVEPVGGAGTRVVPLAEAGFYEIRPSAGDPLVVAVNIAAGESDLSPIDPTELAPSVTSPVATPAGTAARDITPEEGERRQSLWWYLLAAGLLLLVIEAAVASRLPRIA